MIRKCEPLIRGCAADNVHSALVDKGRALEVYSRRRRHLISNNISFIGLDELLSSIECLDGAVFALQLDFVEKNVVLFVNEKLDCSVGVVVVDR